MGCKAKLCGAVWLNCGVWRGVAKLWSLAWLSAGCDVFSAMLGG